MALGRLPDMASDHRVGSARFGSGRRARGVRAFRERGDGTPAPVAPTEKLVVGGMYRHVRNPMYLAVGAVILGQAAVFGRVVLVAYALIFAAVVWSFVHWYEEPTL
ncbi:MAG TPA: methyltransferase, partial [Actinomycetota bacterium]|nr:methyltransferase [Actinomycetota bacterium]